MDIHEVAVLIHIAEKSNQWPRLKPIHDEVMRMLEGHAQETMENAKRRQASAPKAVPASEVPVEARDPDDEQPEEGELKRRDV